MATYLNSIPGHPHFTDEKTPVGEGHVPGIAAEPKALDSENPWAFPAQAAPLYGRLNHAGFKDPITIP